MTHIRVIDTADTAGKLDWPGVAAALRAGHQRPRATIGDRFLEREHGKLLCRSAWIAELGIGVKSVTIVPGNAALDLPTIHGGMLVFDDRTGHVEALIDSDVVTRWKTAGDSVLGARFLAPETPRSLLVVGAGHVAASLIEAYPAIFPSLERISLWNRNPDKAATLASKSTGAPCEISVAGDLSSAVGDADIVATATMARDPVISGEWVRPGTHVDLIGAFTPEMREADDSLIRKARIFVDCRDTTIDEIGELMIPIRAGLITPADVIGDLYDLAGGAPGRLADDDITVFKNGGGAHLDLMTARYILDKLAGGS